MHTRDSSTVGSDTLTNPVLLVTVATNSRKASVGRIATNNSKASVGCLATKSSKAKFSIGLSKCYIEVATESTSQSVSVLGSRPPKLVFVSRTPNLVRVSQSPESKRVSCQFIPRNETSAQCSSVSGISKSTSAIVKTPRPLVRKRTERPPVR
jgi:hypothetical protein